MQRTNEVGFVSKLFNCHFVKCRFLISGIINLEEQRQPL